MNSPEHRHERLRALFLKASSLPAGERAACIRDGCDGDTLLEAEVLGLLAHDSTNVGEHLLRIPLVSPEVLPRNILVDPAEAELRPGSRLGNYTIEALIGMGGMGAVYRARQDKPDRIVALKVIQPALATPSMLRRIELEAELLGRLHHPGIAQIYEAGTFETSSQNSPSTSVARPFFAMEFIDGPNLTGYAAAKTLDARARIDLVRRVCDAVQHAHQNGVIHRDLKPGNILVDSTGQPKVVDFGVAMASDPDLRLTTMSAGIGRIIGTIQYMSPEQFVGDVAQVDTRSDVYSLGVVLYELLTGRLPHALESRTIPEIARVIREEPHAPLGSVVRSLRGDLDIVISRALSKDPSRRYASAGALGDDLSRFLDGHPIQARADSVFYVLRKRINRYRGIVAAASIAAIGLSIATLVAIGKARDAFEAKRQADELRGVAEAETQRAKTQSEALRRQAYFANVGFASAALQEGEIARVRRALAECPEDLRGWEWRYLANRSDVSVAQLQVFDDQLNVATVDPLSVTCLLYGKGVAVIDPATRQIRSRVSLPTGTFAVAALGEKLLCCAGGHLVVIGADGTVESESTCAQDAAVRAIVPGGQFALLSSGSRHLDCVAIDSGKVAWSIDLSAAIQLVHPSADGKQIFVGAAMEGIVTMLDATDGRVLDVLATGNGGVRSLALSPKGDRLAVGGVDGSLRIWNAGAKDNAQPLARNRIHSNKVTALAWNFDGSRIATGSSDHLLHLVDPISADVLATFAGHERTIAALGFSGVQTIVSASLDGSVRWWDASKSSDDASVKLGSSLYACAVSVDGQQLFSAGTGRRLYILDAITLRSAGFITHEHGSAFDIELVDKDRSVAMASSDGTLDLYSLAKPNSPPRRLLSSSASVQDVEWCEARDWLLAVGADGIARAIELQSGKEIFSWSNAGRALSAIAIDRQARRIAVGESSGVVHVIDADSRRELARLDGLTDMPWQIIFSHDGESVFAAGGDWRVLSWPAGGGPAKVFSGHTGAVHCLALSPDGKRMVTGGHDNTVRLWDVASGTELLLLPGHTGSVHGVCFSREGDRIYSCSDVGAIKVWTAPVSDQHQ